MPLTENNKKAVGDHVFKWVEEVGQLGVEGAGFAAIVNKCNSLTDYIMDLCQKAYDKGIEETVNKKD